MVHLSPFDIGYIAGIIDGEGTITILKNRDNRNRSGYCYRQVVQVANTNRDVIEWLRQTTGLGYVAVCNGNNGRKFYAWRIHGKDASKLLPIILPCLKIKRKNAELLLEYQKIMRPHRQRRYMGKDELEHAEKLFEEIKKLNKHKRKEAEQ
jgi:hypothetical protein